MERTKVKCSCCGREISKSNITRHEATCAGNVGKVSYKLTHDGLDCQFCGKTCKNRNSLCNHERMCSLNPDKQLNVGFSEFNAARAAGVVTSWNTGLTKDTHKSIRKQAESLVSWYAEHPDHHNGGYIPTSARNVKYGTYKGYFCDSSWELAFLLYHLDRGDNIKRCTESFNYIFDNEIHKYYPDFIIDSIYYEIKGRYTDRDHAKIAQFPIDRQLCVIDKANIYKYISYSKNKYGVNFAELYDKDLPSWLNSGRRYLKDDQ